MQQNQLRRKEDENPDCILDRGTIWKNLLSIYLSRVSPKIIINPLMIKPVTRIIRNEYPNILSRVRIFILFSPLDLRLPGHHT